MAQQPVHPDSRPCAADSLVQTSLWGIDSHGIAWLPHCLNRIAQGSIGARPNIVVTPTGPCTVQGAGDRALGIVVARRAVEAAMQRRTPGSPAWRLRTPTASPHPSAGTGRSSARTRFRWRSRGVA